MGQADRALVAAAMDAFAGDPVHVVASLPAEGDGVVRRRGNVTLARFVPHSLVLDRAVCVVTHGGMGVTQKALDRGIPVCAVPFGRNQFEVARRIEVARCGVRLPARPAQRAAAAGRGAVGDDDVRWRGRGGGGVRRDRRGSPRRGGGRGRGDLGVNGRAKRDPARRNHERTSARTSVRA